jgi:glycosyltransferase involved in cell wall biosynthesis
VQVLAAAHGLAPHRPVEVLFRASTPVDAEDLLRRHGHAPRAGLTVRVLPRSGAVASVAFWGGVLRWWLRWEGRGIALVRTPRYGLRAARAMPGLPLVAEVHGLDDPRLAELLPRCVGAVCNSRGTARGVARLAPGLPQVVLANAARGPGPTWHGEGEGIGYVGSVRAGKGLEVLAELSKRIDDPVVLVTPDVEQARQLGGRLVVESCLAPAAVPARLARFRCLVVPLAPGPFGEVETCPLKLFDALASGRPVVVADAPTLHEDLVPRWVPRYRMGDAHGLARAIDAAVASAPRFAGARHGVRTWDDRGRELDAFLSEVCP